MLLFKEVDDTDCRFLYNLLAQRDETINISHKKLPSYEAHCMFVNTRGKGYYKVYQIVYISKRDKIGVFYITQNNEIGIFIAKKFCGLGYGKLIMKRILKEHKGLIANINPANERSIAFFESLGFRLIQYTYKLES
jgi:RimJ/RimL family protein N-acetyltransferase